MIPGAQKPVDEVPNPSDPIGLFQQNVALGEDMGLNVQDTEEGYDDRGNRVKTLTMQDGSKHFITEYEYNYDCGIPEMTTDLHVDAEGNEITWTTSEVHHPNGMLKTNISFPDGTHFVGTQTPEGVKTAAFTLPDGRHGVLPPNNPFFSGNVPTAVGGALTGLDAHAGRGGKIPMLSADAVENIGKGAKYGGPALGILTTIYDMGVAETPYDRCIAGFAGGFGVVGDYVGGWGGAAAGTIAPPGWQAWTVAAASVGGAYFGGQWMKSLGAKIGVGFCQ